VSKLVTHIPQATCSGDNTVAITNTKTQETTARLVGHKSGVKNVVWNPNQPSERGRYLAEPALMYVQTSWQALDVTGAFVFGICASQPQTKMEMVSLSVVIKYSYVLATFSHPACPNYHNQECA
jgi:WD40 repeat protein